jgi:hypothetical protein
LYRLAVAEQLDQLAQQNGELRLAFRHAPRDRFQPLDVAAMVGAEHIDHLVEAAVVLVLEVGNVGGEIGVGAVRLDQRTIHVVTDFGRAEQRLFAIFPIFRQLALRWRQRALVDVTLEGQVVDGRADGGPPLACSVRSEKNTS